PATRCPPEPLPSRAPADDHNPLPSGAGPHADGLTRAAGPSRPGPSRRSVWCGGAPPAVGSRLRVQSGSGLGNATARHLRRRPRLTPPRPRRHHPRAAMRIHLISPTHYLRDGSLHKTTRYWTSGITLPYLKALTPPPHEVSFPDELMTDLDLARVEREADVVGLTAMGPQIRRAYDLADPFR